MKTLSTLCTTVALLAVMIGAAGPAQATLSARSQQLDAAGIPFWFQDVTGAAAQPCLIDARCGVVVPNGTFNGTFPVSFPGNFPEEYFYWSAQSATFPLGALGDTSDVLLALEVVFVDANGNLVGPTAAGATGFVFQRLRVTISPPQGGQLPASGSVTATGPWGTSTFDIATECGAPQNNKKCQITRDIPAAAIPPINFDLALGAGGFTVLNQSISTFLKQSAVTRPAGFFGDGAVLGVTEPPATVTVNAPAGTNSTDQWTITGQTTGLDIAPAGLQDFHEVRSGAAPDPTTTKTFTITNLTGAPTTAAPVITAPVGYTIPVAGNLCAAPLTATGPGSICTFDVAFTPALGANGIITGNVSVTAPPAPPATVAVTGDAEGTIPVVAITGISQFTTLTSQLISGTASDFGHPVASVTVSVNAGPPQPAALDAGGGWSITVTGLTPNAVNNIAVTATDVALPTGNTNTVNESIIVDTIPPAVTLTAPANGNLSNIKSPVLTFTATDTNLAATIVKVDNTIVNKVSGNTLDPLADGTHSITVDASDGAGTHTVVTNTISVDATPPVITVTSPKAGNIGTASPPLTFTADDANPDATKTVVRLDTVVVPAGTTTLGPFAPGVAHTLTVDATDLVGNVSPTTTVNFTVILADGRVVDPNEPTPTIADALATLRHVVNITPLTQDQFAHADVAPLDPVTGVPVPNGIVDIADALVILRKVVGLITTF